jgi:hypothetical protein
MTDPEDPPRLVDAQDAPPGLRAALQRARADVGSDAQVARLAAKLGPLLGPTAPASPGPAGPAAGSGVTAKLGLGALALIVAGGGAWLLSAPTHSAPSTAPAPPAASHAVVPAPPAPPVAEPSAPDAPRAAPSAVKLPPSNKPSTVAPLSEAELLEQARAALKVGDSARAFQRVSEHALRYPRGVLVQEREVLAIQALRRLGREAEADRRAEAFARAYPGSAFQRKLQR